MLQDDAGGSSEIIRDMVGGGLKLRVTPANPGPNEDGAQAGAAGHFDVPGLIADHPRAFRLDPEISACALEKAGGRLAAPTGDFEFRALPGKAAVRMMGAEVNSVEVCAFFPEFPLQASVRGGDIRLARLAASDDRLVRQDHEPVAGLPQRPQCRRDAGKELQLVWRAQVSVFD